MHELEYQSPVQTNYESEFKTNLQINQTMNIIFFVTRCNYKKLEFPQVFALNKYDMFFDRLIQMNVLSL